MVAVLFLWVAPGCPDRPLGVPELDGGNTGGIDSPDLARLQACGTSDPALLLASNLDPDARSIVVGEQGVFYPGADGQVWRVRRDGSEVVPLIDMALKADPFGAAFLALVGEHLYASKQYCDAEGTCSTIVDIDPESGAATPLVSTPPGDATIVADEAGVYWSHWDLPSSSIRQWTPGGGARLVAVVDPVFALALDSSELFAIPLVPYPDQGPLLAFDRVTFVQREVLSKDYAPNLVVGAGEELFVSVGPGKIIKLPKHGGPLTELAVGHYPEAIAVGADAVYFTDTGFFQPSPGLFCVPREGGPVVRLHEGPIYAYAPVAVYDDFVYFAVGPFDPKGGGGAMALYKIHQ